MRPSKSIKLLFFEESLLLSGVKLLMDPSVFPKHAMQFVFSSKRWPSTNHFSLRHESAPGHFEVQLQVFKPRRFISFS